MSFKIIYRIEHGDGIGPYQREEVDKDFLKYYQKGEHPFPWDDFDNWDYWDDSANEHLIFGCPSLAKYKSWFPKEHRKMLSENGYSLRKYKIPTSELLVGRSGKQVAFNRADAKLVASISPVV